MADLYNALEWARNNWKWVGAVALAAFLLGWGLS